MIGQYTLSEAIKNGYSLVLTKLMYPGARLIRRPFYLRGEKSGFTFGPGLTTGYSCRFEVHTPNARLQIGKNCKINDRVHISSYDLIEIGDDVLIGSNVLITDNSHGSYGDSKTDESPLTSPDVRRIVSDPVYIGDRVWIGEYVSILPGVTIGEGSVIGANSVVTHDVQPDSVVAGNPAKPIKLWNSGLQKWESF